MIRPVSRGWAALVAVVQHLLAIGVMVCLFLSEVGQTVTIHGAEGEAVYDLYESDRARGYEDSVLFNNIFGNNLSSVARLVAACSQLETKGVYDGERTVDVTAYVNRGTTLPGDYITARYSVSNLIKWAQNGFTYDDREMTEAQVAQFLARRTTWTHIRNNSVSGGMNAYLNAMIEGNVETHTGEEERPELLGENDYAFFNDPYLNGDQAPATHSLLVNRYRTVDGYNIEDLVADWSDYQTLADNVVEAARGISVSYEDYLKLKQYYVPATSSMRYYVVRTIGGKREIYTNVQELAGTAKTERVEAYFDGLLRHLYYCPYDLAYETDSLIREETVRSIFRQYSYAYPDQIRIYAGVFASGDGVRDDFSVGRERAGSYTFSARSARSMAVLFGVFWLLLLLLRLRWAGHVSPAGAGEKALYLAPMDRWPTEVLAALWLMGLALSWSIPEKLIQEVGGAELPLGVARAFLLSAVLVWGILSFARKAKAGRLLSDLLVHRASLGLARMARYTTTHGNLAVAVWIPYLLFVGVNLAVTALLFYQQSAVRIPGMIALICLDVAVGFSLYHSRIGRRQIIEGLERIGAEKTGYHIGTEGMHGENLRLALAVNAIGEGIEEAVNTSMQDERLKTELITNVSHDIKTPLTSIINYIDLLKREEIPGERAQSYLGVLEQKSMQLKALTEDLVEASKISSGNIEIDLQRLNYVEFIRQTLGEFSEKFEEKELNPVLHVPEEAVFILADAHHLWRVMENLLGNVAKYSMPRTRVYLDLRISDPAGDGHRDAILQIRNISAAELHIDPRELTERFIRGDESRTSEGSGLGLSIADHLTKAQGGVLEIGIDGDLFKATLWFPVREEEQEAA